MCLQARMLSNIAPPRRRTAAMSDESPRRAGDRIMLFKQANLALLLQGHKDFDARKV